MLLLLLVLLISGGLQAGAESRLDAPTALPTESRIALDTGLDFQILPEEILLPCPFGYFAEVCASELNPGFEFIPVDGPLLFTGETLGAAARVHTIRVAKANSGIGKRSIRSGESRSAASWSFSGNGRESVSRFASPWDSSSFTWRPSRSRGARATCSPR